MYLSSVIVCSVDSTICACVSTYDYLSVEHNFMFHLKLLNIMKYNLSTEYGVHHAAKNSKKFVSLSHRVFSQICVGSEFWRFFFSIFLFDYKKGNPSCWKNMRSQMKATTHSTNVYTYFLNLLRYDILNVLNVNKRYKYALFDARLECFTKILFICFGLYSTQL